MPPQQELSWPQNGGHAAPYHPVLVDQMGRAVCPAGHHPCSGVLASTAATGTGAHLPRPNATSAATVGMTTCAAQGGQRGIFVAHEQARLLQQATMHALHLQGSPGQ